MIVYYVADEEKPKNAVGVKFYIDYAMAMNSLSDENRGKRIFSFNVTDKCDASNFGLETMLLLKKSVNGELRFIASGTWVELHDVMSVPFYIDFETRFPSYVSMSHSYFRSHYKIVPLMEERFRFEDDLRIPSEIKLESTPIVEAEIKSEIKNIVEIEDKKENDEIDSTILSELFGVEDTSVEKTENVTDLTDLLFGGIYGEK